MLVALLSWGPARDSDEPSARLASTEATAATAGTTATGGPVAIQIGVSGTNGVGMADTGRACADGGDGASWHYDQRAGLAPGVFSALPGEAHVHLDVHRDNPSGGTPPGLMAFLMATDSRVTLVNERGALPLVLQSGSCGSPTLTFTGGSVLGPGSWTVGGGTGSYRNASGSGTFRMTADLTPGANNAWMLQLDGTLSVLAPSIEVEYVGSYWAWPSTDFVERRVSTIHRIVNRGSGDAFAARITATSSPTTGVKALGPKPQAVGDLGPEESELVRTQWQVDPAACPVLVGCNFQTTFTVEALDALDGPTTRTRTTTARAPLLPPPL